MSLTENRTTFWEKSLRDIYLEKYVRITNFHDNIFTRTMKIRYFIELGKYWNMFS